MTGGLLGRYVAEERDSGRKLAACYAQLCANTGRRRRRRRAAPAQGEGEAEGDEAAATRLTAARLTRHLRTGPSTCPAILFRGAPSVWPDRGDQVLPQRWIARRTAGTT